MLQDRLFVNALIISLIVHIVALIAFSAITFHRPEIEQIVPVNLITIEGKVPQASSKESTAPKSAVKEEPPPPELKEPDPTKPEPKVVDALKLDSPSQTEKAELPKAKAPERVDLGSVVTLKPEEVMALRKVDLGRESQKKSAASDKEEGLAPKSTLKESTPSEPKAEALAAKKVDLAAQFSQKVDIKADSLGPRISEDEPKAPEVNKAEPPLTEKALEKYPPKVGENGESSSKQEREPRVDKSEERSIVLPASVVPQRVDDQVKKAKEITSEKVLKQGANDKSLDELKAPEALALKDLTPSREKEAPVVDRPEPRRIDSKEGPETVISVPGGNFEIKWSGIQREVVERVIPEYPEKAQREGIKPVITLRFWVKPNGEVDRAVIERTGGYRELDGLAVEAMKKWKFNPLIGEGNPKMQQGTITMRYELKR